MNNNTCATLRVENLNVCYGAAHVLRDVSLSITSGQIIGLVGESGCGKSTLLRSILHLPKQASNITGGHIFLNDLPLDTLPEKAMRSIRGAEISMIFQNYDMALSPIVTIGKQLHDTARAHGLREKTAAEEKLLELFARMHLPDGRRILNSYSFELSGGMNQRVCIALSMVFEPAFLLADEPTSALDVTVQSQVIHQLLELRDTYRTGILLATHNIRLVQQLADSIGVIYGGMLVEFGSRDAVLTHPLHPYTKNLLAAVPKLDGPVPQAIAGCPPSYTGYQPGCRFSPRCNHACDSCRAKTPERYGTAQHWALCPLESGVMR